MMRWTDICMLRMVHTSTTHPPPSPCVSVTRVPGTKQHPCEPRCGRASRCTGSGMYSDPIVTMGFAIHGRHRRASASTIPRRRLGVTRHWKVWPVAAGWRRRRVRNEGTRDNTNEAGSGKKTSLFPRSSPTLSCDARTDRRGIKKIGGTTFMVVAAPFSCFFFLLLCDLGFFTM